jgi:hypothetical protein
MQALAAHGYILAAGKRPYVLVDIYGHMNALPKLIDDKTVRLKDIRAFLEKDFPPESLPTVQQAKKLAATHRKSFEDHRAHEQKAAAITHLEKVQARRRQEITQQQTALRQRQHRETQTLTRQHRTERDAQRSSYRFATTAVDRCLKWCVLRAAPKRCTKSSLGHSKYLFYRN